MAEVLNSEHLNEINKAIKLAEESLDSIKKAKQAGIDVSDSEKDITENLKKLRAIKQVYFPGK